MKQLTKPQINKIKKSLCRVENFISNSGNTVANQFRIYTENGVTFQSYSTIIAIRLRSGQVVLDAGMWDCTVTTGKYRNQFLGCGVAETREKITNGDYQLADLN